MTNQQETHLEIYNQTKEMAVVMMADMGLIWNGEPSLICDKHPDPKVRLAWSVVIGFQEICFGHKMADIIEAVENPKLIG